VFYLCLIVLIPLAALFARPLGMGGAAFWAAIASPRTVAAFRISFGLALLAALINAFFGLIVAWMLVRVPIPGKRVIDAIVDLPFALPTAVAGIALATLYSPTGWVGGILASFGIHVAFTPAGILVAMVFIGLPFVVRTVQPVLDDVEQDQEEAAATLGANPFSIFVRVTLPAIGPALLSGFALAFARGVGEYGSIIFIAGNLPGQSEILPLLIVVKLQQFDYAGASAIATVMLATSFLILITLNSLERWQQRRRFGLGA
jgi:sulfate transport system permease protein